MCCIYCKSLTAAEILLLHLLLLLRSLFDAIHRSTLNNYAAFTETHKSSSYGYYRVELKRQQIQLVSDFNDVFLL